MFWLHGLSIVSDVYNINFKTSSIRSNKRHLRWCGVESRAGLRHLGNSAVVYLPVYMQGRHMIKDK